MAGSSTDVRPVALGAVSATGGARQPRPYTLPTLRATSGTSVEEPAICYAERVSTDEPQVAAAAPEKTPDLVEAQAGAPERRAVRLLRETSRVEAFSDGVFSIAATLL